MADRQDLGCRPGPTATLTIANSASSTSVPTKAQITATQQQAAALATTIAHEQAQTAALSQQYDAAQQALQTVNAQLTPPT